MDDGESQGRERLLFVAPWVPSRQRPRSLGILKALAEDYDVTALLLVWSAQDSADVHELIALLPEHTDIRVVRLGRIGGLARAACAVFSRRPLQQAFTGARKADTAIRRAIADTAPDIVFFNVIRSANFLPLARGMRVVDLDEFRSDYYRQLLATGRNPLWRVIARIEAGRLSRAEEQVVDQADAVLVSSPAELRPDGVVRLVRSPHALDLSPGDGAELRLAPSSALFVGRLSYRANREALAWYVQHVVPELRRRGAAGTLYIVGRGAGPDVRALVADGVELIGAVDEVAPYYAAADVCIVPIQMATGVQMKLIEAAVLGRAIVTTRISAERAGLVDGIHCLVAESPTEWADAVQRLHGSPQLRAELGVRAQAWAADAYDSRAIGESLRVALADGRARRDLAPHEPEAEHPQRQH